MAVMGFSKTIPKVADLARAAEVRSFLKTILDPKIQDGFLEELLAEKKAIEELEGSAREATAALAEKETQIHAKEKDISTAIIKLENLTADYDSNRKTLEKERQALNERQATLNGNELDLAKRIKALAKDREGLDSVLAEKDAAVEKDRQSLAKAERLAQAAKERFEQKLQSITNAARD